MGSDCGAVANRDDYRPAAVAGSTEVSASSLTISLPCRVTGKRSQIPDVLPLKYTRLSDLLPRSRPQLAVLSY